MLVLNTNVATSIKNMIDYATPGFSTSFEVFDGFPQGVPSRYGGGVYFAWFFETSTPHCALRSFIGHATPVRAFCRYECLASASYMRGSGLGFESFA